MKAHPAGQFGQKRHGATNFVKTGLALHIPLHQGHEDQISGAA
jgi:hypothetical protein